MPVVIHPPFVGYGKSLEVTNATIADDSQTLTFDNSGSAYSIGDLVLVSTASDTQIQFMGEVTQDLGASGVKVEYYSNSAKGTGNAKVWQPTYGFEFTYNFDSPAMIETDEGVEAFRTLGGAVYSVRFSDGGDTLEWRFPAMWRGDWKKWIDFLRNDRAKGLEPFTAAWFDFEDIDPDNPATSNGVSRIASVKNGTRQSVFRAPHLGAQQTSLRLLVDTYDEYVAS
jgi:hypothetical protein